MAQAGMTNSVVLFNDDGVSDLGAQMREHGEALRQVLTDWQIRKLAYVEGALQFGSPEAAVSELNGLDEATRNTREGKILALRIQNEVANGDWMERARAAMRQHLGGKTKMSKSGQELIFSTPQCGRSDLASYREFAAAQLGAAGISLA